MKLLYNVLPDSHILREVLTFQKTLQPPSTTAKFSITVNDIKHKVEADPAALLATTPNPDDSEIEAAMYSNSCRCRTYDHIKAAVKTAAGKM